MPNSIFIDGVRAPTNEIFTQWNFHAKLKQAQVTKYLVQVPTSSQSGQNFNEEKKI